MITVEALVAKSCRGNTTKLRIESGTGTIKRRNRSGKAKSLKNAFPNEKMTRPIREKTIMARDTTATAPA